MAADPLTLFVVLLALAFVPSLVYLRIIRNLEKYGREPMGKLMKAFVWGAAWSIMWVTVINRIIFAGVEGIGIYLEDHYDETGVFIILAVVMAPLVEELVKMWGVSSQARIKGEIDEVEDGLIYGAAIGLGFAATENLLYGYMALDESGATAAMATLIVRSISSTLLHTSAAALTGYGVARVIVQHEPLKVMLRYYLFAVILHAMFNGFAVAGTALGGGMASTLSFLGVLALAWLAIDHVRHKIHQLDTRPLDEQHREGHIHGHQPSRERRRQPETPPRPRRSGGPGSGVEVKARTRERHGSPTSAKARSITRPSEPGLLELEIRDTTGRSSMVKVPATLTVAKLTESARSHFRLPPRRYGLSLSGRLLPPGQAIGQTDIQARDVIILVSGT